MSLDLREIRECLEDELWEELLERAGSLDEGALHAYGLREAKKLLRAAGVRLDWSSIAGQILEAGISALLRELVAEAREIAGRPVRDRQRLALAASRLLPRLLTTSRQSAPEDLPLEPDEEEEDEQPTVLAPQPSMLQTIRGIFRRSPSSASEARQRAEASIDADQARLAGGGVIEVLP